MCAIFGISGDREASNLAYLGLHSLQHRGQEGAGIVSTDGQEVFAHKQQGLVADVFSPESLAGLKGAAAIGHTRYSTAGGNTAAGLQPLLMKSSLGWLSIAHNGNLVNASKLSAELEQEGAIFQSSSDTEVILHLLARSREKDPEKALAVALQRVEGAYSLLVLNHEKLIAIRDPHGFRPLVMGTLRGAPVFASETCAFDLIGAQYIREVEPGEMIVVPLANPAAFRSLSPFAQKAPRKRCVFEYIYFARPDSLLYGERVHEMRKILGRQLALEQPALDADVVVPVPDSGVPAAIGFSQASGIPFDIGIIRSHYVGRTFIEPQQSIRDFGVKLKLSPVRSVVENKNVVIVDDSLVRGTTSRKLIQHLRDAGAKKVHVRISAPPSTHSCFYGIDTPTRKELLASHMTVEQIGQSIGADSLGYISRKGLLEAATRAAGEGFCDACFSGEYPTPL